MIKHHTSHRPTPVALRTVAKFAGIDEKRVRAAVESIRRRPRVSHHARSAFALRNTRAIETVARFSGLDAKRIAQTLEHGDSTQHWLEDLHSNMAA